MFTTLTIILPYFKSYKDWVDQLLIKYFKVLIFKYLGLLVGTELSRNSKNNKVKNLTFLPHICLVQT